MTAEVARRGRRPSGLVRPRWRDREEPADTLT
jgi:hypothetical protein